MHLIGELGPGLDARPATPADIEAVFAVIAAEQRATLGALDAALEDLRADWRRPGFDLAADSLLIADDDGIVAYAEVSDGRAMVHVHPEQEYLEIGRALVSWTERRARAIGWTSLGQTVAVTHEDALDLLAGSGYTPRWDTWVLERSLDGTVPAPFLPDGVALATLRRPDEDEPVHALIETAFSEWPGREHVQSFEDWRASVLEREDTDAGLSWVAHRDGVIVGAALCLAYDDEDDGATGWVDQLAVARTERGQGIGAGLLLAAFAEFARRGLGRVGLSTDSRTGARDLYEGVGMRVTRTYQRWSRTL